MVWPVGAVSKITTSKAVPFVGRHVQEVGETVEGGHFGRAGPAHLLFHHLHHLRRESGADGRHGPVDVFLGRPVGVDLHGPQVRNPSDRRDLMADRLLEDIRQVGGRIGGDDQRALAFVGIAHGVVQAMLVLPTPPLPEKKINSVLMQLAPFNVALISARVG